MIRKNPEKKEDTSYFGFCAYCAEVMTPLLRDLTHELEGVKTGDDIEYVHQSRVATRRIRAAFPVFSSCFSEGSMDEWKREIRRITRSLGQARDLDVQIEFIRSYIQKREENAPQNPTFFSLEQDTKDNSCQETAIIIRYQEPEEKRKKFLTKIRSFFSPNHPHPEKPEENLQECREILHSPDIALPGLECLLLRLIQQREEIQPELCKVTDRVKKSGVIEDMTDYLHELKVKSILETGEIKGIYSYEQAFMQIMVRVFKLQWYEPCISDETRIHEHHAMRIAAKHLRYTLEIFSGLFEDELKKEIKTFKKLQDILGEMHDCDVWHEMLPGFLRGEEERAELYFGNTRFLTIIKPGIQVLSDDLMRKRAELFKNLGKTWKEMKNDRFFENLEERISVPVQYAFRGEITQDNEGPITLALISDVHANFPALIAVLEDAHSRGAMSVLNAGDSIGYGAFPDQTINFLRINHVMSVIGNYDQSVLKKKWKGKKLKSRDKLVAMRWAYHNILPENRTWLSGLPVSMRLRVRGKTILVTHGSPDSITEYLVDETPQSRLESIASSSGADIIVTGHSHIPSAREAGKTWFINCGSVGRSEDGDNRACYALLTLNPFSITHIRVPYDIGRAVDEIHRRHLPGSFARIISEGRPLDVMAEDEEEH